MPVKAENNHGRAVRAVRDRLKREGEHAAEMIGRALDEARGRAVIVALSVVEGKSITEIVSLLQKSDYRWMATRDTVHRTISRARRAAKELVR